MIDVLLGDKKTLTTSLPVQGVITLMEQKTKNRFVCHLLYAVPVKRGEKTEIIEDIVPLYGIKTTIRLEKKPKRVYSAPDMNEICYSYDGKFLSFIIDKLELHKIVVIEF